MRRPHLLFLAFAAGQAALSGQTQAEATPFRAVSSSQAGIQGVSVFSGYYTSGSPATWEISVQSPSSGASAVGGIVATFGGSKSGEKSTFSWSYSPSYFNIFYANDDVVNYGSVNHRAGVTWSRRLGRKWGVNSSVNGMIANLEQLYFSQGVLSTVASMPTTFDDLAAAMLNGKYSDAKLAALLSGSPFEASAQQGYLYGSRMLSASASMSLTWTASERTSISASLSGSRSQHLNGKDGASERAGAYFVPQMTTAGAGIAWAYSLSPRTQITASASTSRTFSSLQRGYGSYATIGLGRTMSRRWFAHVMAGSGTFNYSRQTYAVPHSVQYLYGGGLGYRTYAHSFLASYNRTLGDTYGLGSGATSTAMGAWNWRIPGRMWAVMANGGYQQLENPFFKNPRSWQAGAGGAQSLGRHFSISIQYVYVIYPADLRAAGSDNERHGVMVSVTWSP